MTSLQKQLASIAASTTYQLDLKAQKAAHGKSLLFDPRIATYQSFDEIYQICYEGYQELCTLDSRFVPFSSTLFSEQSKSEDRTQMTKKENEALDSVVESFLALVGPRLLLRPAVKAAEWLIRRFRIHEYNINHVILTFLPYHSTPLFPTLLAILPAGGIPPTFRFLMPYITSVANPPRHAIIHTAAHTPAFFSAVQNYTLKTLQMGHHASLFLSFWASTTTQAIDAILESAHSGRKDIQHQREEELILRILPILNKILGFPGVTEAILSCYMIITVLVTKATFEDKLLNALMEAVIFSHSADTWDACLVCLAVIAEERDSVSLSPPVLRRLLKMQDICQRLRSLSGQCRVERLALGCAIGAIEHMGTPSESEEKEIAGQILTSALLNNVQIDLTLDALAQSTARITSIPDCSPKLSHGLGELVKYLNKSPNLSDKMERAFREHEIEVEELETQLEFEYRPTDAAISLRADEDSMELDGPVRSTSAPDQTDLSTLPSETKTLSFLETAPTEFEEITHLFTQIILMSGDVEAFLRSPVLGRKSGIEKPLFLSFLIRIWCGPYSPAVRSGALRQATNFVREAGSATDFQALIPYLLFGLSDSATTVRRSTAECIIALSKISGQEKTTRWGALALYGMDTARLSWLASEDAARFFSAALLPNLEECILDSSHINRALQQLLDGSSFPSRSPGVKAASELRPATRNSFISFLSKNAVLTPLIGVRLQLFSILSALGKPGIAARADTLIPAVHQWCLLSAIEVTATCSFEKIDVTHSDDQHLAMIFPREKEGLSLMKGLICGTVNHERWAIQDAAFKRLRAIWSMLRSEDRLSIAMSLLEMTLDEDESDDVAKRIRRISALETLRSIKLSSSILASFIESIPTSARLPTRSPATKRRRTSRSETTRVEVQTPENTAKLLDKVTIILELVEASNPAEHPLLVKGLFNVLGDIQQLKQQSGSDLVYLQNLVLGSLLPIVNKLRDADEPVEDTTAIRADLLVECIRHTSNPQIQNTGLLLISSLASWIPELVLHNLMPIFTFMGSTVLRQHDDYSAHVVDHTIARVVPQLAMSLRKRNKDFLAGIADLLLSFTAAFEHIPLHRRLKLFSQLSMTLGPEDALPAILGLLIDRYPSMADQKRFASELLSQFSPWVALQSFKGYLTLVADALLPKRTISDVLFSLNEKPADQVESAIVNLLASLAELIDDSTLRARIDKALRQQEEGQQMQPLFAEIMEKTVRILQQTSNGSQSYYACSRVLTNALNLLPAVDIIKSTELLLENPNDQVRRAALKSVEVKVASIQQTDVVSINALLMFLSNIEVILRDSSDVSLKLIATNCIDQVAEKFGKKDPLAIMSAARAVSSTLSHDHAHIRLSVLSMLCLASVVEAVQDEFISLLPDVLPKAFHFLQESLERKSNKQELHNAVFALLSAIIQRLSFIFTGQYLEEAFVLSHRSAAAQLGQDCDQSRIDFRNTVARSIDTKELFASITKTWPTAIEHGHRAVKEQVETLTIAIEQHSKAAILRANQPLFSLLLTMFDFRNDIFRHQGGMKYAETDVSEIENGMNQAAISMTLKLNDATFQPFFVRLVKWAAEIRPKHNSIDTTRRATTFFLFLADFFNRFKSIVTSYASYIIDHGARVLDDVTQADEECQKLCKAAMLALRTSFRYDQDGFWQAPAHFGVVMGPITSQLSTQAAITVNDEVIPTVTELAASASSVENLRELNGVLLRFMRSEEPHIRIAAVRCQQSLTRRLGEDWLGLLAEMLPIISELREDDDETVERETNSWITTMEEILGESLDPMLQ